MKQRCLNKNNPRWYSYGGRGIKVCKRWMDFTKFYADMGNPPDNMTLDRINNNGNYTPDNCKWSDAIEQQNNMRTNHFVTYKNKTKTVSQWAIYLGINKSTLSKRLSRGWSTKRALSTIN